MAVGVVAKEGHILLAKRAKHQHQGGLWEFPGGKVEPDEPVTQALGRELREELAIEVTACEPLLAVNHDYGDKQVCLDVWLVSGFNGEAQGVEGQPLEWVPVAKLASYEFPQANVAIVEHIQKHFTEIA